jgi:hypothetical protein
MTKIRLALMTPLLLALGAGTVAVGGITAQAAAPANGCPAGYELLSVATLSAEGYRVPAEVDSPTSGILSFGQPGNGDGWVCGVQLGNQLTSFGLPIYNFIDDQLPSSNVSSGS